MFDKKSLVLLSAKGGNEKAVLSMQCERNMLSGKLRLYSFGSEPKGIISLGIFDKSKVVKAGLTKISPMLFSFQTQIENLPQDFSCAVVNFVGGEPTPLLFGTTEGQSDKEEVFDNVIASLQSAKTMSDVEKVLDENGIDYDEEEKEEIANLIDKELSDCDDCTEEKCKECKYRKFYYSHISSLSEEEVDFIEDKPDEIYRKPNESYAFYDEIRPQVEKLFENNQSEDYLEKLIPNSKWVKVQFEESGDYYVFGLIYADEKLKYVCYGVPGIYQKQPPRELSGYPVWFPLDEERNEGFGYWLTYQDANSGESVRAIVE